MVIALLFSFNSTTLRRAFLLLCAAALLSFPAFFASAAPRADDTPSDAVGVIEGESIQISGPMSVEVVHGQVKTMLRSGSDIHVKAGDARVDLVEGGSFTICGPAHLSVLKSGGALTIALDTGTIHVHINRQPSLTIYTPQIKASPLAIGSGPQDAVVGFDSPGAMCIRPNGGAIRLEQQLTGQSLVIPQGGDVLLTNGQLDNLTNSAGRCSCDLQEKSSSAPSVEVSRLATPEEIRERASHANSVDAPPAQKSDPSVGPIYQIYAPPLVYDAKAKVQRDFDPKLIILVRKIRVRPTLIFQGRVEGQAVASAAPPPPKPIATLSPAKPANPPAPTFTDRVRNFVHKFWPSS